MKTNRELALKAAGVLWKQDRQTCESVTKIIADAYAEAFPRWIPCSERMPEIPKGKTCVKVLVTDGDDVWIEKYYERMRFLSVDDEDIARISWQPLPQPPEETT